MVARPVGWRNVVDKLVVGGSQGVRVGVISLGVVVLNVPKEAVIALLVAVGEEKAGHELLFDLGGGLLSFDVSWDVRVNRNLIQLVLDSGCSPNPAPSWSAVATRCLNVS